MVLQGAVCSQNRVSSFPAVNVQRPLEIAVMSGLALGPLHGIAAWHGDALTVWTSSQMIAWAVRDLSETLLIPREKICVISPFIGGGFGAKLRIKSDALVAALGARAAGRPVI